MLLFREVLRDLSEFFPDPGDLELDFPIKNLEIIRRSAEKSKISDMHIHRRSRDFPLNLQSFKATFFSTFSSKYSLKRSKIRASHIKPIMHALLYIAHHYLQCSVASTRLSNCFKSLLLLFLSGSHTKNWRPQEWVLSSVVTDNDFAYTAPHQKS